MPYEKMIKSQIYFVNNLDISIYLFTLQRKKVQYSGNVQTFSENNEQTKTA